jgi:hypothetical protein
MRSIYIHRENILPVNNEISMKAQVMHRLWDDVTLAHSGRDQHTFQATSAYKISADVLVEVVPGGIVLK